MRLITFFTIISVPVVFADERSIPVQQADQYKKIEDSSVQNLDHVTLKGKQGNEQVERNNLLLHPNVPQAGIPPIIRPSAQAQVAKKKKANTQHLSKETLPPSTGDQLKLHASIPPTIRDSIQSQLSEEKMAVKEQPLRADHPPYINDQGATSAIIPKKIRPEEQGE